MLGVVVGEELKDNNHETSVEWLVEAASSGEVKPSAAILRSTGGPKTDDRGRECCQVLQLECCI